MSSVLPFFLSCLLRRDLLKLLSKLKKLRMMAKYLRIWWVSAIGIFLATSSGNKRGFLIFCSLPVFTIIHNFVAIIIELNCFRVFIFRKKLFSSLARRVSFTNDAVLSECLGERTEKRWSFITRSPRIKHGLRTTSLSEKMWSALLTRRLYFTNIGRL